MAKKILLFVCWYYELFPLDQTLNSNLYHQQLKQLIGQKQSELVNKKDIVFKIKSDRTYL